MQRDLSWWALEAFQNLAKRRQAARRGNNTPASTDKLSPNHMNMVATHRRQIVQTVRLIEHEMNGLGLEMWAHRTTKKPVHFRESFIIRPGRIRDDQHWVTPLLRKRVFVNLPLFHRACCRRSAASIRFASSMSSAL